MFLAKFRLVAYSTLILFVGPFFFDSFLSRAIYGFPEPQARFFLAFQIGWSILSYVVASIVLRTVLNVAFILVPFSFLVHGATWFLNHQQPQITLLSFIPISLTTAFIYTGSYSLMVSEDVWRTLLCTLASLSPLAVRFLLKMEALQAFCILDLFGAGVSLWTFWSPEDPLSSKIVIGAFRAANSNWGSGIKKFVFTGSGAPRRDSRVQYSQRPIFTVTAITIWSVATIMNFSTFIIHMDILLPKQEYFRDIFTIIIIPLMFVPKLIQSLLARTWTPHYELMIIWSVHLVQALATLLVWHHWIVGVIASVCFVATGASILTHISRLIHRKSLFPQKKSSSSELMPQSDSVILQEVVITLGVGCMISFYAWVPANIKTDSARISLAALVCLVLVCISVLGPFMGYIIDSHIKNHAASQVATGRSANSSILSIFWDIPCSESEETEIWDTTSAHYYNSDSSITDEEVPLLCFRAEHPPVEQAAYP